MPALGSGPSNQQLIEPAPDRETEGWEGWEDLLPAAGSQPGPSAWGQPQLPSDTCRWPGQSF